MVERLIDISNGTLLGACVLWALYFLTTPPDDAPKRLRKWSGVLMLFIGIQTLLCITCTFLTPTKMDDVGASVTVNLLAIPFTVFVMMELTRLRRVTCQCAVMHLSIPVLLAAVYVVQLLWDMLGRNVTLLLYCIWMGCYTAYYIYKFTVAAHRYEEILGDTYADVDGRSINWLSRVLAISGGILAVFVIVIFQMDDHWTWVAYNMFAVLFLTALCYNISLMRDNEAIDNEAIASPLPTYPFEGGDECHRTTGVAQTVTEPSEQDVTEEEEQNDMISDLRTIIVERELYMQPNLTRETAARALGTNHNELIRRIKSETGMTFSQFVTAIRLDHAAELLTSTTMTADEILYACGFRSNSTFYRQFAERYHCSPIEYRQNNNNQ